MPKEGELCQAFDVRQSQKVAADTNQRFIFIFYFIVVLQIIKETNDKEIFRLWLLKTLF